MVKKGKNSGTIGFCFFFQELFHSRRHSNFKSWMRTQSDVSTTCQPLGTLLFQLSIHYFLHHAALVLYRSFDCSCQRLHCSPHLLCWKIIDISVRLTARSRRAVPFFVTLSTHICQNLVGYFFLL